MKPVMQTTFNDEGNCFSACVASLLELESADDVPTFYLDNPSGWWIDYQRWLFERNYWPQLFPMSLPVFHIASGISPRGFSHAVIYKGDDFVHDPHPEGGGVDKVSGRSYIIPVEIKAAAPTKTQRSTN